MKNRKVIYTVLLVLGLALIGSGLGVYFTSKPEAAAPIVISGIPMINMQVTQNNASTYSSLYIYENRRVLDIEQSDARPDLDRQASKILKYVEISQQDYDSLVQVITNSVDQLNESYQYGPYDKGDMDTVLVINYQGISKTVTAKGYLSLYSSYTDPASKYAGMPAPLDVICKSLNMIAVQTVEFKRESVQ